MTELDSFWTDFNAIEIEINSSLETLDSSLGQPLCYIYIVHFEYAYYYNRRITQ